MPKLHPLTSESPSPLIKSTAPSTVPPQPLTVAKATTAATSPAMPQLHRMPTAVPVGTPPVPRLSMPSLKPGVVTVTPRPQTSIPHSLAHSAVPTTSHTPPPLNMPPVKHPPPQPTSENLRKMADTRMPPSLSSLGMTGSQKSTTKHAQSRSGKFISGTKVKSRKKK